MTNENSKDDGLMDELASVRPKQSENNPISAIKPYSDGIEIQYGSKTYSLMTDDAVELYALYEMMH